MYQWSEKLSEAKNSGTLSPPDTNRPHAANRTTYLVMLQ